MPVIYLFLIGLFTSSLCCVFLYVSIHEMRRLNPDPLRRDDNSDAS